MWYGSVSLLPLLLLFASQPVSASVTSQCLAVERAFATNDAERLRKLSLEDPRWQVQQNFRLAAIYIPAEQRSDALVVVRRGLRIVNTHLKQHPDDVEMLLLGTMLDGQYLLLQRWRFLHNGLRGLRRLAAAEKLDPGNPRAALIRGSAKIVLPRVLGGSPGEAIELLAAVDVTTALCEEGEWAQVDILNWLARAYGAAGDHTKARQVFAAALRRDPHNHWVKLAMQGRGYRWEGD